MVAIIDQNANNMNNKFQQKKLKRHKLTDFYN